MHPFRLPVPFFALALCACGGSPPVVPLDGPATTSAPVPSCERALEHYLVMRRSEGQPDPDEWVRPDFLGLCEKAGPTGVACGLDAKVTRDFAQCFMPKAAPVPSGCERSSETGPVLVAPGYRWVGADTTRFSDRTSSFADPYETCGLYAGLSLLSRLRCDDGRSPFASNREAHDARLKPARPGGRCGSFVDAYEAKCPEKTYVVHIDAYVCEPGKWPH